MDSEVKISLTKFRNMAILRLSWRGSGNSKKYIVQLICVKKDCFYPILVLGMQFLHFWFISQRPKNWLKFPLKTWFFWYGLVGKTWFLEVIWIKMCCFWPVEVSETHFWNFWSKSWGPKHGFQEQKYLNLASTLIFFSGSRNEREGSPIIFQAFLGCIQPS